MTKYQRNSIEREGIDVYLDRTAFDHGGVDWDMFDGFAERGMNISNLMRAMNIKTRDTIEKYLRLRLKYKKKQAEKVSIADVHNV